MKVLDNKQIDQKLKRLAYEIAEEHYGESEIYLLGINNNGRHFSKLIESQLSKIVDAKIILSGIRLNPANPIESEITVDLDVTNLKNKVVIIVDDVANTGRTLFYACKPLMNVLAKTIEVAVLVDRKHKSFPIKVDYVGLSLATTAQEHIDVNLHSKKEQEVILF